MSEPQDLTSVTEAAWSAFRRRLADRLAGFEDDDRLVVQVEVARPVDALGTPVPRLRFVGRADGVVRVDAAGTPRLDEAAREVFLAGRWDLPDGGGDGGDDGGEGQDPVSQVVDARDADRLAISCVRVLREVYAAPHPVFLAAEGLERGSAPPGPRQAVVAQDATRPELDDEDRGTLPRNHDDLQALVDAAVGEQAEVDHDADGDIALRSGSQSVVFVRVLEDRPAVEVFAELVVDPERPERIPVELDILNRTHDFARFTCTPGGIRMGYVLVAWPFVPRQLRIVLTRMLEEVDGLAEQLALRLEGRRFLQEPEPEVPVDTPATPSSVTGRPVPVPTHPGTVGLLELLHLGAVSSPAVGQLFEHDRRAIIAQLVGVRTGVVDCAGHDEARVLSCLRRGLRYVVDREIPERRARRLPPRARSEQPSLIDDDDLGEDTLDLGRSA